MGPWRCTTLQPCSNCLYGWGLTGTSWTENFNGKFCHNAKKPLKMGVMRGATSWLAKP